MKSASQCALSDYQHVGLTGDLYVSQSVNLSASHPVMPAVSQLDYVSEYGFPTCVSQLICQQASHPVSMSDEQSVRLSASQPVIPTVSL